MNDPITLAATEHEDRHGTPDTPSSDDPAQPIRTLLETAATCRPLEEVTALVSLLKESGRLPDAGHEALRKAAVCRPVHDVQRMVALLGEPPHEVVEADITLRAAAVGRSIEDVALLVDILGNERAQRAERAERDERDGRPVPGKRDRRGGRDGWIHRPGRPGPTGPADPYEDQYEEPELHEEPYEPPYQELYDAPYQERPRRTAAAPVAEPATSPALRHVLRWPVALALLVSGVLHLPTDLTTLSSASPGAYLPLLVTALCLGLGALLALRDTPTVWRAGAAVAVGVVALHVVGARCASTRSSARWAAPSPGPVSP